jgi:serine/threonine-protein kinase
MDSKIFLGKYRVAGDEMGAVGELTDSPLAYEGEEIDSGKNVVVEVVPAAPLKAAVRERLEAEAIAAKKLSHVNIPALYDFGVEDDHFVYVTEDFEGTLAEEWVNAHGPMPEGPVLRIAAQVVSALGAAAFHRINHHAINPSNLVLVPGQTAEGEWPLVKVLHFVGVAPKITGTDVAVAAFDKSLHYASPEQIKKGAVDFRSEIYSLGCTMWFLLTGAPPLVATAGSSAAQPPTAGLAEEKISGMSKKTRRLLAQMLSVNPEARPGDPLAFYRKLQDCLNQVERKETMARKFGIPVFSSTRAAGTPGPRRSSLKTLARAAVLLAMAALAALVLRGYLQHRREVRAEEPIGVPIGVPDASASATPAKLNATDAMAANTVPSTTVAPDLAKTEPAPVKSAESDKSDAQALETNSVESTATNQIAVAPAPPPAASPSIPQAQEPISITENNASTRPPTTDSEVTVAAQVELPPATAKSRPVETDAVASQTAPKKIIMREVRRGELVEGPEVRRAEPLPPEEGPENSIPETTASTSQQPDPVTKPEQSRDVEPEKAKTPAPSVKQSDPKPKVAAKSRAKKTPEPAKSKRQAGPRLYLPQPMDESEGRKPLPPGMARARFVGVTPEGDWMLELPSNKIVIVPPPPSRR